MGFLSGIGRAIRAPGFADRLQAALAAAGGDASAILRLRALQQQQAELQRQGEADRLTRDARDAQVIGAKNLGFSNDEIGAMSPQALSWAARQRIVSRGFGPGDGAEGAGAGGGGGADGTFPPADRGLQPAPGDFVALGMPGGAVSFDRPYKPALPGLGKGLAPGFGVAALGGALAGIPRAGTPAQLAAISNGKFFIAPNGSIRKKI